MSKIYKPHSNEIHLKVLAKCPGINVGALLTKYPGFISHDSLIKMNEYYGEPVETYAPLVNQVDDPLKFWFIPTSCVVDNLNLPESLRKYLYDRDDSGASPHPWSHIDLPGWNLNLEEAKEQPLSSSNRIILLVKNHPVKEAGIFNTKIILGYYNPNRGFMSELTPIPDSDILAWKFFNDPIDKSRTLEPHEYALLAGLISGLIHNKTIQGSLFSNLHDKLLKIVGINP